MASESDLHRHIFARSADLARTFPHVLIGPGDDCAVVASSPTLLLTVDHVVEHRHFTSDLPIDLIARKAIARSASDIAAMAGSPAWSLAAAILPPDYPHADALFDACDRWARALNAPLVGGDVATGPPGSPLSLSITMGGSPNPHRGPVLRSTARPGDDVFITGRIGGSLPSGRHAAFSPRVAEAAYLAHALGHALHAMIDISDGLGRDAARVAAASGVRLEIDASLIPLHPERAGDPRAAVADGEDYELLFTAPAGSFHTLRPPASLAPFTRIGRVTQGQGCTLLIAGAPPMDLSSAGWDHT